MEAFNVDPHGMARSSDPDTSRDAAQQVRYRAGSQVMRLLDAFARAGRMGLTDEQAADVTGLSANRAACWWRRCSDLRDAGYIVDTGERRMGMAGAPRMVCAITDTGYRVARPAA
jgi:hypothetical protein